MPNRSAPRADGALRLTGRQARDHRLPHAASIRPRPGGRVPEPAGAARAAPADHRRDGALAGAGSLRSQDHPLGAGSGRRRAHAPPHRQDPLSVAARGRPPARGEAARAGRGRTERAPRPGRRARRRSLHASARRVRLRRGSGTRGGPLPARHPDSRGHGGRGAARRSGRGRDRAPRSGAPPRSRSSRRRHVQRARAHDRHAQAAAARLAPDAGERSAAAGRDHRRSGAAAGRMPTWWHWCA